MVRWQTRAANGWLDFPKKSSDELSEWHSKGQVEGTLVITVKGTAREYIIDFNKMTNTAVSTGRERQIRKPEKGARLHTRPRNPKSRAKIGNPTKSEKDAAKSASNGPSPGSPNDAPPSSPAHNTSETEVEPSTDVGATPSTFSFQDESEIKSLGDRNTHPSSPARITEVEPSIDVRAAPPTGFPQDEADNMVVSDRNAPPPTTLFQEEAEIKPLDDRKSASDSIPKIETVSWTEKDQEMTNTLRALTPSDRERSTIVTENPEFSLDLPADMAILAMSRLTNSGPKTETVCWTEEDQEMTKTLQMLTPAARMCGTIVTENPECSPNRPTGMSMLGMSHLPEEISKASTLTKSKKSTRSNETNSHAGRDSLTSAC